MLRLAFYSLLLAFACLVAGAGVVTWYVLPQLPPVEALREVQLQTPLKVYTRDLKLIAEFGEMRRAPVAIADVPLVLKQAFLAAEDDRFYDHPGVDWMAIKRALIGLVQTREKKQGGSTITMQVARNFFLSPEKTYERKLKEVLLAVIIERELSKDEILELYLNKIFLGHRAYGVAAAAQVYYGTTLDRLDLAQSATIAGLPQAPSRDNPITNPQAALVRRAYVLGRMLKLGYIDQVAHDEAASAPNTAAWHGQAIEASAPHVAEMARDMALARYGESAYTSGHRVITTVDSRLQEAANEALVKALLDYDTRHGYRGAEARVVVPAGSGAEQWRSALAEKRVSGGLEPALVLSVDGQTATVFSAAHGELTLTWDGLRWGRPYLSHDAVGAAPENAAQIVAPGDIVRIARIVAAAPSSAGAASEAAQAVAAAEPMQWRLAQLPAVEGALVSLDPQDGRVLALVGGFDYERSKFNRVVQARRQPGSSFKPFVYSAALDKGYTAASFINDAPIVFDAPGLANAWRPENYSGEYYGPTRLREALTKSRNLVSIRLLRAIGVDYTLAYIARFGFDAQLLPANLSMALGSGEVTPLELAIGYAVLANGGYKVEPWFVDRIESAAGEELYRAEPLTVCRVCERTDLDADGEPLDLSALQTMQELPPVRSAPRVIEAENAWIMTSMLQDVIKAGTGARARALGRHDLAGKTGTTNDQKDAWFAGFNTRMVTTAWIGFDQVAPLGRRETGAQAALPMWMDYMRVALDGMPPSELERPPGLVSVRIDPDTGLLAGANHPNAIFESFRRDQVPMRGIETGASPAGAPGGSDLLPEQIF
jgi:penicillin-binding protein 1A